MRGHGDIHPRTVSAGSLGPMARPSATRPVSASRFPTRTPTLGWTSPHEAPSVEHVWSCRAPRSNRHVTRNMIMKIYAVTMG